MLLLAPTVVYLFIKKTEDCFACFNRHPTRYSSYQFSHHIVAVKGVGAVESKQGNRLDGSMYETFRLSEKEPNNGAALLNESEIFGTLKGSYKPSYDEYSDNLIRHYAGDVHDTIHTGEIESAFSSSSE
jgi:hypothetical protein